MELVSKNQTGFGNDVKPLVAEGLLGVRQDWEERKQRYALPSLWGGQSRRQPALGGARCVRSEPCKQGSRLSQRSRERSSRAHGDCSGEGRPSKWSRIPQQVSAVGPHPNEALRARPTSPRFAGRGDMRGGRMLEMNRASIVSPTLPGRIVRPTLPTQAGRVKSISPPLWGGQSRRQPALGGARCVRSEPCKQGSHLSQRSWERSSRAHGDCSGEGRPTKSSRIPHQDCAGGPHPNEALRARPTSPRFAGRGDMRGGRMLEVDRTSIVSPALPGKLAKGSFSDPPDASWEGEIYFTSPLGRSESAVAGSGWGSQC